MRSLGRTVCIVNLDPGCSPQLPYDAAIDIRELITLQDAMDCYGLGPNGALVYCMETLQRNLPWLQQRLAQLPADAYLMLDFPGQVELYTFSSALDEVFSLLRSLSQQLSVVHLVDSFHLHNPHNFLSALLLSLQSMCRLELPHLNVFSKADTLQSMGDLPLPLEYYTQLTDLNFLLQSMRDAETRETTAAVSGRRLQQQQSAQSADAEGDGDDEEEWVEFETGADDGEEEEEEEEEAAAVEERDAAGASSSSARYWRMSRLICELVDSYSLVSFSTLSIQDKDSALRLLRIIDTSNGYAFTNNNVELALQAQQQQQQHRGDTQAAAPSSSRSMFNLVNTQETQPKDLPPSVADTAAALSAQLSCTGRSSTDCLHTLPVSARLCCQAADTRAR